MASDSYTTQPPPMRRLGRSSVLSSPPRRHSSTRASSELMVRYTPRQLRQAFRSVQSPLASAVGAIMFGLGAATVLIGVATRSIGAWPLIMAGVMVAFVGGAILSVPVLQARTVAQRHGEGGVVAIRLLANQNGLVVFDGEASTLTAWSSVDRVQIHDRHVGLVVGRSFVVPPLRLDDDQGPFAARVIHYASASNAIMPMRTSTPSR